MKWSQSRVSLPLPNVHVSLEDEPGSLHRGSKPRLVTRVYQKSLNSYLYIPWKSCHSSKRAWVKGELIRYVRISSREEDFKRMQVLFTQRLCDRGYPGKWLSKVFSEVSYAEERPRALDSKLPIPPWECEKHRLYVLKLTHNPIWEEINFNPIWGILREAWNECGLGKSTDRFLASFKEPAALGDVLNKINRETLNAYQV
ncbi:hypothetical protein B0H16DRAFT_1315870 [Mycena metata]|uniref:Helix-turn-helix domain-containing protein n=1 Tax=Mycena metata TaxID=1033252 RepID=A0AAD7J4U3_9AGAR|nr:hypothetical protein B0H16DRAFT_1315870 [Mycena metata]